MALTLSPGIGCCEVDGVAILLDLNQDRYFALRGVANNALLSLAHGDDTPPAGAAELDTLVSRGILRYAPMPRSTILTSAPAIEASVLDRDSTGDDGKVIRTLAGAGAALARATVRMRSTSLQRHVALVTRQPVAGSEHDASFDDRAARFDGARRYLPFGRTCLRDSLALLSYFRALSTRPQIVFGVRTDPFRAHCWIQHRGVLLNEAVDLARLFTPILIV